MCFKNENSQLISSHDFNNIIGRKWLRADTELRMAGRSETVSCEDSREHRRVDAGDVFPAWIGRQHHTYGQRVPFPEGGR